MLILFQNYIITYEKGRSLLYLEHETKEDMSYH
jgi:hypothetical protein